jgi:hypothetical protein
VTNIQQQLLKSGSRKVLIRDEWGVVKEGAINDGGGGGTLSMITSLVLAYITVSLGLVVLSHWQKGVVFPDGVSIIAFLIGGVLIIPFFALFYAMFKSANVKVHFFLYGWMLLLAIIARLYMTKQGF